MEWLKPIIKGLCVAIILGCLGLNVDQVQWWGAMISLNVALGL